MILLWLISVPVIAGLLAWLMARWSVSTARWISLLSLLLDLVIVVIIWIQHSSEFAITYHGPWILEFMHPWIQQIGVSFHFGMDGLSLILIALTAFLGLTAVGCSWTEIQDRAGFFYFNLLWVIAGIMGVFLSLDLFLFYFFWEMMLVPMYFLIAIWGHERRIYASVKFFIFTQLSGLLMLLSIVGLFFVHGKATGVYTFDYTKLLGTPMPASIAMWLMLGFFVAFAVKLPGFPFHPWLPDAHTEAPTAGSVILAGLLLKTGAYGLMRFVLPLFPEAAKSFAPIAMTLGVIGILYGALLAFGQTDMKRLVAYTSVSHMGFILLGVFAWNELALQGSIVQIVAHGISTGALFILVGALQERIHTRDLTKMGGFWAYAPRMGGVAMVFTLASLGLPGLGNFVAEFLILLGAFQANIVLASIATVGLVTATVYALWMMQLSFHGKPVPIPGLNDLGRREMVIMSALIIVMVWLGLFPQAIINTASGVIKNMTALEPSAVQVQAQVKSKHLLEEFTMHVADSGETKR
jgi:NADH-quinone oxidoreductase subunit M